MTTDVDIDEKIKLDIKEPSKYKVVLLNDEQTPMEWVIEILMTIFKHSETTSKELTLTIHNEGAVKRTYTYYSQRRRRCSRNVYIRDSRTKSY